MEPKYPEVTVNLSGANGNVFNLMGKTGLALRRAGLGKEAEAFYAEAQKCASYDEVLQLIMRTVETT